MATTLAFDIIARDRASSKFDAVGRSADQADDKVSKFAGVGKKIAAGMLVVGTATVVAGAAVVKSASAAQQSLGATETVFGKFANSVVRDSNKAAEQFGLSANEYRENANLIGSLFKNQGVALDQLGGKTKGMIGTASDLAATFGGTTKEAVEALGSAFKGEFDPLERYGVSLKASTVNTEAGRLAMQKYGKGLDDLSVSQQTAMKQQATAALIAKQSADSQGAFARETDTLAHQQQVLGAKFENVKASLGESLLPVVTKVVSFVSDKALPAFEGFVEGMKTGQGAGGKFASALDKVWGVLKPVGEFLVDNKEAVATFAGILLGVAGAVKVWTAAQILLNVALTANPIGAIIVGVAALAAGLVMAYKKSETFRNIVDASMEAIGKAFRWFWNNVGQPVITMFLTGLSKVMGMFADMVSAMAKVPGFKWLKPLAEGMQTAADKTQNLADNIKKIPEHKSVTIDVTTVYRSRGEKNEHMLDTTTPRKAGEQDGKDYGDGWAAALKLSALKWVKDSKAAATQMVRDWIAAVGEAYRNQLSTMRSLAASLRDQFNEFADFRSVFMGNLFGVDVSGSDGQPGGVAALLAYAQQQRANAEQLQADIAALTNRGIPPELLEQLRAQGASGLAAIHALATANAEDYAAILANLTAAGTIFNQTGTVAAAGTNIAVQMASVARTIQALVDTPLTLIVKWPDGRQTTQSLKAYRRSIGGVPLGFDT